MLRLFIENAELELGEDFSCPITRSFEDIENPTNIKNDFSKTITIPHTQSNDRLFGHIYNPDRLTVTNQKNEALKGIYFDPYKKIDFRLEWNDSVVMTGYLKVLSVTDKGYECTLNGELGKIFQEMQKITFDESNFDTVTDKGKKDREKYWIDGSQYVNTKINKELVYDSWNSEGQSDLILRKKTNSEYKVTDIIGFTPNNAFNDGFDYKTFQTREDKSKLFAEVLEEEASLYLDEEGKKLTYADITGVTGETAVRDGMYPREIGEFRSYLQLPFIYFNKLWQIFQEKAESTTGYKFDLDPDWFNSSNPYWSDIVLELMDYSQIVKQNKTFLSPNVTSSSTDMTIGTSQVVSNIGSYFKFQNVKPSLYDEQTNYFYGTTTKTLAFKNIKISFDWIVQGSEEYRFIHQSGNYMIIELFFMDYATRKIISDVVKIVVAFKGDTIPESEYNYLVQTEDFTQSGATFSTHIEQEVQMPIIAEGEKNTRIAYQVKWKNASAPFIYEDRYDNTGVVFLPQTATNLSLGNNIIVTQNDVTFRSNTYFSLNNLWSNDYNIFKILVNYCKIFRISIIADEVMKTLRFIQTSNYFSDYKIKNYDNKIDKTKDYIIKPITWEKKYILFNYEEMKGDIAENYKKAYNYQYGEKRITTDYDFNDEENKIFSKLYGTIISTDNTLSWTTLYDNLDVIYTIAAEQFISNKDSSGKIVANFGNFFFIHKGEFDKDNDMRNVYISDDTQLQNQTQKYFYSQTQNGIQSLYYQEPELKIVKNNEKILSMMNLPLESYVYDNGYYDNSKGIYDLFWANYINERYNTQNKLVTCYLKLTPSDFINFEFNKFILIDNQLYMVNKIYDYDITNDEPTKVDLITIQDIKGYTTNNYGTDKNN